jgi:hypothetical protein
MLRNQFCCLASKLRPKLTIHNYLLQGADQEGRQSDPSIQIPFAVRSGNEGAYRNLRFCGPVTLICLSVCPPFRQCEGYVRRNNHWAVRVTVLLPFTF